MKAVVGTNVVEYYLLGTEPFVDEVREFWRSADETVAPAHWEAELAHTIWMAVRTRVLPPDEGHRKLDQAARLGIRSISNRSLWQRALARALGSGAAVYDTLFVELAIQRGLSLVTFDRKVLKVFPKIAHRPGAVSST
jgi:predicted nucleic acid-binding protein